MASDAPLPRPERAVGSLDPVADAPARDKRARECCIGGVDRDRVVEHAARSRWRHCPPVCAAVLVELVGHSSVLSAETFRRYGDADADWEAPFGRRDQSTRIALHLVPHSFYDDCTIAPACPAARPPRCAAMR